MKIVVGPVVFLLFISCHSGNESPRLEAMPGSRLTTGSSGNSRRRQSTEVKHHPAEAPSFAEAWLHVDPPIAGDAVENLESYERSFPEPQGRNSRGASFFDSDGKLVQFAHLSYLSKTLKISSASEARSVEPYLQNDDGKIRAITAYAIIDYAKKNGVKIETPPNRAVRDRSDPEFKKLTGEIDDFLKSGE